PHDAAADRGVHPHTPSDIPGVLLMMVVVLLRLAFSLHAASSASSINFRHRLIALMRARTLSRVKPSTASDWLGSITARMRHSWPAYSFDKYASAHACSSMRDVALAVNRRRSETPAISKMTLYNLVGGDLLL